MLLEDQDYTDHEKVLMFIENRVEEQYESVWMLTDNFGRIDHLFSQMNSLYKFRKWPVYLLSQNWISLLVAEHVSNRFIVNRSFLGSSIGLLPLSAPSKISTSGLKWNLGT